MCHLDAATISVTHMRHAEYLEDSMGMSFFFAKLPPRRHRWRLCALRTGSVGQRIASVGRLSVTWLLEWDWMYNW